MNDIVIAALIAGVVSLVGCIIAVVTTNKKVDDIKTDTGELLKENVKESVINVGSIANNNNSLLHGLDKSMNSVLNQSQVLSYLADAEKKREGMQIKELMDRNSFIAQIDKMYVLNQELNRKLSIANERIKKLEMELHKDHNMDMESEMPAIEDSSVDDFTHNYTPSIDDEMEISR